MEIKEKTLSSKNFVPASLKQAQIPNSPGIYKFFANDELIYIGKAKDLRKRVSSYFHNSPKDRKTNQIKLLTDKIETFSTQTEAQALIVEQSLIKENLPKFNILLRDDKSYPYIHFSSSNGFPAISLKRVKNKISPDYIGPYISVKTVKNTLKELQKIFKLRNCSDTTFRNRSRPCIEHQMDRCSAPCVGLISANDYLDDVKLAKRYLLDSNLKFRDQMILKMKKFSEIEEFERANEIKKRITALDMLAYEQYDQNLRSLDFFSISFAHGKTGACILSIRGGKIRGTKTYYFNEDFSNASDLLLNRLIFFHYQNPFALPLKICVSFKASNLNLIKEAIFLKFEIKLSISSIVPKKALHFSQLAALNASQIIENKIHLSEKFDHALFDLASYVGLKKFELNIEGYDISHHSGANGVGSCVKFSKEGPVKKEYRLFNIPSHICGDDIKSLEHVLERRLKQIERSPLPDIILIDGGKSQLNIALKVFNKFEDSELLVLSIVKGSKRIRATETIMAKKGVIEMPVNSPGFIMLQKIRDESHRFAILSNRKKKNHKMRYSQLDCIEGIGPVKKKKLLQVFGSLKSIKNSSLEELIQVPGVNMKIAKRIKLTLNN
jgi:excinuclease ABC subunit C